MQVELGELAPILAEKSEITNKLLNQVANDQSAAQKVKHIFIMRHIMQLVIYHYLVHNYDGCIMKEFIQESNFIIIYSMRFQDNGVKCGIHILNRQEMSEIV